MSLELILTQTPGSTSRNLLSQSNQSLLGLWHTEVPCDSWQQGLRCLGVAGEQSCFQVAFSTAEKGPRCPGTSWKRSKGTEGLTCSSPQEKVSQLKDEVRLQYEKMHQILDEDLRKTMEILDKAQAKFCNENAAQVLHLNERMQEAKKLLSSVQVMFDKTEDINFMKVRQAALAREGWGLWRGLVVWEELGRCGVWWGVGWGH